MDLALKEAFRNAVRQVVGTLVDAETLVKNDELVDDKILTYSNGFIKTYMEIPGSQKTQGGVCRLKIKAVVETGGLIAKLKAASVTIKEFDGKGLFAEVVSKIESEKEGATFLTKKLNKYPLSIMSFSSFEKPSVLDKSEKFVTMSVPVRIDVKMNAFNEYVEQLESVLSKAALYSNEFVIDLKPMDDEYHYLNNGSLTNKFLDNYSATNKKLKEDFFGKVLDEKYYRETKLNPYHSEMIGNIKKYVGNQYHGVVLNKNKNNSATQYKFKYFVIKKIFTNDYFYRKKTLNLKVSFLNNNADVLSEKEFLVPSPFQFYDGGLHSHESSEMGYNAFWITPLFLIDTYPLYFSSHLIAKPKIEVGLDVLKKVTDIKIEALSDDM